MVTVDAPYVWTQTEWSLTGAANDGLPGFGELTKPRYHVVAYDYGVKRNILRMLAERGCKVTVVPAQTSADDALASDLIWPTPALAPKDHCAELAKAFKG